MARHFVLSTGAMMPSVGLSTWQSDPGVVGDVVYAAVKVRSANKFALAPFLDDREHVTVFGSGRRGTDTSIVPGFTATKRR
jgi:hypothetical protein